MNDNELFEKARRRVQGKIKGRCVTNKDVIIDQEKEIEQYRNKIRKLTDVIENKEVHSKDNCIEVEVNLEVEETINKLEKINQLIIDIKENAIKTGIDFGQDKDYTTTQIYVDGELVKEETIQYK